MRRTRLSALGVLGMVLLASACGSSGTRPKATGYTTTVSAPTTAASTIPFHLAAPASSPTCAQATASRSPEAVISAFRAARIAGKAAEGCLTSRALSAYCGPRSCGPDLFSGAKAPSPGPICLYACNGKVVRSITVRNAEKGSSGSISVELEVTGGPTTEESIDSETIILGPGVPSTGSQTKPLVIVAATTCC